MFSCFSKKENIGKLNILFVDKVCIFLLSCVTYKWPNFDNFLIRFWVLEVKLILSKFGRIISMERSVSVALNPEVWFIELTKREAGFLFVFTWVSGIRGLPLLKYCLVTFVRNHWFRSWSLEFFICVSVMVPHCQSEC